MINCLFEDVYKTRNIAHVMRTTYALANNKVGLFFFDPRKRLEEIKEELKGKNEGAYENISQVTHFKKIENIDKFLEEYNGRKIAIEITKDAIPLTDFSFKENDLLIFGNERTGLKKSTLKSIDYSVVVPMYGLPYRKLDNESKMSDDGQPLIGVESHIALNVAITHSITLSQAMMQLGYFKEFSVKHLFPKNLKKYF